MRISNPEGECGVSLLIIGCRRGEETPDTW